MKYFLMNKFLWWNFFWSFLFQCEYSLLLFHVSVLSARKPHSLPNKPLLKQTWLCNLVLLSLWVPHILHFSNLRLDLFSFSIFSISFCSLLNSILGIFLISVFVFNWMGFAMFGSFSDEFLFLLVLSFNVLF